MPRSVPASEPWCLFLPQMVVAEPAYTSPGRVATMHDYVRDHVVCDDGSCSEDAEFAEIEDEPAYECTCEQNVCPDRWWASADYLMWWVQGNQLPALVTTGPGAGVLGQPGTSVLFGDQACR